MKDYYDLHLGRLEDMMNDLNEKESSFLRHIQLLAASIFGIIVVLNDNTEESQCIRTVFFLAILSLSVGILLSTFVLIDHRRLQRKAYQSYYNELINAIHQKRRVNDVVVKNMKIFFYLKVLSYLLFFSAIGLLVVYSYLKLF